MRIKDIRKNKKVKPLIPNNSVKKMTWNMLLKIRYRQFLVRKRTKRQIKLTRMSTKKFLQRRKYHSVKISNQSLQIDFYQLI